MIKIRSKDQEKPGAPGFPELISSFWQKLESIKEELYYNWENWKAEENHDWLSTCSCMKWVGKFKKNPSTKVFKKTGEIMLAVKPISQFTWSRHWVVTLSNYAVVSLDRRGVIKTWTEVAARVRLNMLASNLTSLVPPQFSHWLQVGKVGTAYIYFLVFFLNLGWH